MEPVFKEVAPEYGQRVKFFSLEVGENQELAVRYAVLGVPATLLFKNFKNRQLMNTISGYVAREKLAEKVAEMVGKKI